MHCVQGTVPFGTIAKGSNKEVVPELKGILKQISSNNLLFFWYFSKVYGEQAKGKNYINKKNTAIESQ